MQLDMHVLSSAMQALGKGRPGARFFLPRTLARWLAGANTLGYCFNVI